MLSTLPLSLLLLLLLLLVILGLLLFATPLLSGTATCFDLPQWSDRAILTGLTSVCYSSVGQCFAIFVSLWLLVMFNIFICSKMTCER